MCQKAKIAILWLAFQPWWIGLMAAGGPLKTKASVSEGSATLLLLNHRPVRYKDSVYITCDRYDLSGAGIVRSIFYPKRNHTIDLKGIPAGKYYLTVQFLGTHHDHFEKVLRIRPNECRSIELELQPRDEYDKENVRIPPASFHLENLAVVQMK